MFQETKEKLAREEAIEREAAEEMKAKLEELKQQVEFLEHQRLEQQWDGDDNGAAETEAVGDRPVAKSRYHARGIASATTKRPCT